MIWVTNGENFAPCEGPIPAGHWESSKDEYDRRIALIEEQTAALVQEIISSHNDLVRSAREKLVAGLPLTAEEAALIVF
jgi:hypothetical protein